MPNGKVHMTEDPVIPQDNIMPQFGAVFGLMESASQVVLHEMGLLKYEEKRNSYAICRSGWDDLCAEFKVEQLVEMQKTSFSKKSLNYVRLGLVPDHALNPSRIWKAYNKNRRSIRYPCAIGDRRTTGFVLKDLRGIIHSSSLFHKITNMNY